MGWNFFDAVYCINLRERPDRRAEARRQFAAVGLAERVRFVVVDRHPSNPERGCYESHLLCMEQALEAGAERFLIFEDDIRFDRFDPAVLRSAVAFLSDCHEWHMLFLGCMVRRSRRAAYPAILQIAHRSLTHAYAINRSFAGTLLRKPWQGVPYDDMLRDLADPFTFAVYPSFAFQSSSPSDNIRYLPLDRVRRLFGGLRRLQKLDEFLHLHFRVLVALHLAALMGVTAWLAV